MPLYTYKCRECGLVEEKLVKSSDVGIFHFLCPNRKEGSAAANMDLVLSTPSAPQWNCRTAHSRSKGF